MIGRHCQRTICVTNDQYPRCSHVREHDDDDDVDDDEDDNEIGAKDWKPQSDRYVWIWRGEANRTSINDFC